MTSLRRVASASLVFLAVITVAAGQRQLYVLYTRPAICALKGSAVTMSFTYSNSILNKPRRVFWSAESTDGPRGQESPNLSLIPEYRGRVEYTSHRNQEWSLILSNVTEEDQGKYYPVVISASGGRSRGRGGVSLTVTDLQVEGAEPALEGSPVSLTCKTACILTEIPTFTWYKQALSLLFSTNSGQLCLPSVSKQDEGSYSCGINGQSYRSPAVTLNVHYLPKSLLVSISPTTGEIVEGSLVTLTCISDATAPFHSYTWYKGGSPVATGQTYVINPISSEDSGTYQCLARSRFRDLIFSADGVLNVVYPPKSASASVSPAGRIVEGRTVTLTCSGDGNPPAGSFAWYKGRTFVGHGRVYSTGRIVSEDSGEYMCKASNPYGDKYSNGVTLDVLAPPKSVSVSVSPAGVIAEGSLVTLTCVCDANPPVHTYTWYRVNESSPVGSGPRLSFAANSSDGGRFYCEAENEIGSQRAAGVHVAATGSSGAAFSFMSVWVAVGVGVGVGVSGIAALVAGVYCMRRAWQRGNRVNHQDGVRLADDAAYMCLEPATRSSNDVYSTLSTGGTKPPDDAYTALDRRTVSADYHTLATCLGAQQRQLDGAGNRMNRLANRLLNH